MARRRRKSYTSPLMIARRNRGSRYFHRPGALIRWLKSPPPSSEEQRAAFAHMLNTLATSINSISEGLNDIAPILNERFTNLSKTLRDLNTPTDQR